MDWIKVTPETIPPDKAPVILTVRYKDWGKPMDKNGIVLPLAWREGNRWYVYDNSKEERAPIWCKFIITHWMPYPKPADD